MDKEFRFKYDVQSLVPETDMEELTRRIQEYMAVKSVNRFPAYQIVISIDDGKVETYAGKVLVALRGSRAKPVFEIHVENAEDSSAYLIRTRFPIENAKFVFNRKMSEDDYETYYKILNCVKEAYKSNKSNIT